MGLMEDNEKGFSSSLLSGEYNEEESFKSFQEAVMQWRSEKSNSGGLITANKMWIPVRPGELPFSNFVYLLIKWSTEN